MITIAIPKNSLFIQTDKPIYKPGQTGNKINHLHVFCYGWELKGRNFYQSEYNQLAWEPLLDIGNQLAIYKI